MSSEIKVSYGALSAAAADITASTGRLQDHLRTLESALAPMVAGWEGEASVFYQDTQRRWNTAAAELTEVLRLTGTKVNTANDNYRQADNHARNLFA